MVMYQRKRRKMEELYEDIAESEFERAGGSHGSQDQGKAPLFDGSSGCTCSQNWLVTSPLPARGDVRHFGEICPEI